MPITRRGSNATVPRDVVSRVSPTLALPFLVKHTCLQFSTFALKTMIFITADGLSKCEFFCLPDPFAVIVTDADQTDFETDSITSISVRGSLALIWSSGPSTRTRVMNDFFAYRS